MNFLKSIAWKRILFGSVILLVFISFAVKVVHQPGFIKKALCEQSSLSDEEETPDDFLVFIADLSVPVPAYQVVFQVDLQAENQVSGPFDPPSWPAKWICYHQMKIDAVG